MNNSLSLFFNNLKVNKLFSKCLRISQQKNFVKFDINFSKTPEIFVTVNKFVITYGADGTLEKKDLKWSLDNEKVVFDKEQLSQETSIPICILATESN